MSKHRVFNGFHNSQSVWNLSHINSIPVTNIIPENDDTIRYNDNTKSWELINANEFYGPEGPQGPQGIDGETGPQGPQGVIGFTGNDGFKGNTGPIGIIGLIGNTGVIGNAGFKGPQGISVQGATGFRGNTGPTSLVQGPQGSQGPQGPQGYIGTGLSFSSITTINCFWRTSTFPQISFNFNLNCERINNIIRITIPGVSFNSGPFFEYTAPFFLVPQNGATILPVLPLNYIPDNDTWAGISNTNVSSVLNVTGNNELNILVITGKTTSTGFSPGTIFINNTFVGKSFTIYGFSVVCYTTS
jgi:hypothetical protein